MKNKNKMIVMMGGPGTGKGTFSNKLCKLYPGYTYVDTGAVLRALPDGSPIRELIAGGNLLPDETVSKIVYDAVNQTAGDVILDGFPRSVGQAQFLVENFKNKYDIHILFLNATDDVMKAHIIKRRNAGSTRQDDSDDEIINKRICAFHQTTMPAVQWLSAQTIPYITFSDIYSNEEESKNFARILDALGK